jgi:GT2 family glycosyltransferase
MPTCGEPCLERCLETLYRHTDPGLDCQLWLVMNHDDPQRLANVAGMVAHRDLVYLSIPQKIGYTQACNYGWQLANPADNDYFAILNDDLVFDGEWTGPLLAALDAGATLAGPAIHHVGRDGYWGRGDEQYQFIEGWCFMARAAHLTGAAAAFGQSPFYELFDSKFGMGYCEDVDLSIRLQRLGGKLRQVDVPIRHLHSQTYGHERPSWAANRQYLMSKWDLG